MPEAARLRSGNTKTGTPLRGCLSAGRTPILGRLSAHVRCGAHWARDCCCVPRELGNFEAAAESFQKVLLLDRNHVQALQLRGVLLYRHGSLREALGSFKVSAARPGRGPRAAARSTLGAEAPALTRLRPRCRSAACSSSQTTKCAST